VAITHFFRVVGNVLVRFERPRTRLTALEPLSDEQLDRFVAATRSFCPRDRAVALVFADTGIRLKEAVRLNLDSLVISGQCFALNLDRDGRCRQLVLEGETVTALGHYLLSNKEFTRSDSPQSGKPLFVDKVGKRLSMRGLTACVKKVGWRAKLSVTPAILRATRLSRLASQMKDVVALANLAGFECPESARRIIKAGQKDITSFSVEADVDAFAVAQPQVFLRV
jgi:site-specific recombinase XerC